MSQAHPGGPHHRTLLLVLSDHGQTLGGDHGGSSREEVDTVLAAFNLHAWWAHRTQRQSGKGVQAAFYEQKAGTDAIAARQHVHGDALGHSTPPPGQGPDTARVAAQGSAIEGTAKPGHAPPRVAAHASADQHIAVEAPTNGEPLQPAGVSSQRGSATGTPCHIPPRVPAQGSVTEGTPIHHTPPHVPATLTVSQLDFTATFAMLMGLPVPYSNMGGVDAALWRVLAQTSRGEGRVCGDGGVGQRDGDVCGGGVEMGVCGGDTQREFDALMLTAKQVRELSYIQTHSQTRTHTHTHIYGSAACCMPECRDGTALTSVYCGVVTCA